MSTKTQVTSRSSLTPGMPEDDLFVVSGVAIGPNDVTHHEDEETGEIISKIWTPEALRKAAHTLEGRHIVVNHENSDVREVIGQITESFYEDGVGVIYRGVIDDEVIANRISQDWLDVSARIIHPPGRESEESDHLVMEDIWMLENLSIVRRGNAPSNDIQLGDRDQVDVDDLGSLFETELSETVEKYKDFEISELILDSARTPDYDGTETQSWGDIPGSTLSYYIENLDIEGDRWSDLSESERQEIASHTLLGDSDADTAAQGIFFPVVNAATGNLNRGALEAVRSGRGQAAEIPEDTYASAYSVAGRLLNEEFDADVETEFTENSSEDSTEEEQETQAEEESQSDEESELQYGSLTRLKTTDNDLRVTGTLGVNERSSENDTMTDDEIMERLEAQAKLHDAPVDELTLVPESEIEEQDEQAEELSSELSEKEEEIDELESELEDLKDEQEDLQEEVETVKSVYAEELSEMKEMDEEAFMDRFDVSELRELYEDSVSDEEAEEEEAGGSVDELTGTPDPASGDDTPPGSGSPELSEEEQAKLEELEAKIEMVEGKKSDLARNALETYQAEKEELLN